MYHLFQVYGIESEYVIVNKENLKVENLAEKILRHFHQNRLKNEVKLNDHISISNELVGTLIELKTTYPKNTLQFDDVINEAVLCINAFLEQFNTVLMPTGMHPLLDPKKEMYLWNNGNKKIYHTYNKIFDCKGHGWSNLQSVHINLPFLGDNEFFLLHNAIRVVIPIIPALASSSPIVEGKKFLLDSRLYFYERNQKKVPTITGKVIPEYITSIEEYKNKIFSKMFKEISQYDPQKNLQKEWLNSRGAIPRFDRNAIEIRIMDVQESPKMDFTLINLFVEMIKFLVNHNYQKSLGLPILYKIYKESIMNGTKTILPEEYLRIWGINKNKKNIREFVKSILKFIPYPQKYNESLDIILKQGSLSERILMYFKKNRLDLSQKNIIKVYKKLIKHLQENTSFYN